MSDEGRPFEIPNPFPPFPFPFDKGTPVLEPTPLTLWTWLTPELDYVADLKQPVFASAETLRPDATDREGITLEGAWLVAPHHFIVHAWGIMHVANVASPRYVDEAWLHVGEKRYGVGPIDFVHELAVPVTIPAQQRFQLIVRWSATRFVSAPDRDETVRRAWLRGVAHRPMA